MTYLANVPSLGHVASSEMNTLMLDLLFCVAITILVWKYKRAAIDPFDFGRTKVDSLKVGELLLILQCIGELRSILCVSGELRLIP